MRTSLTLSVVISACCATSPLRAQTDPREFNHSVCIVPFTEAGECKYYATWSSSFGNGWEHDIYQEIVSFNQGVLNVESGPFRYIGDGSDEAQEPVSAAGNGALILTAWEDGIGNGTASGVDVHGQLHLPDGSIVRTNWVVAGGAADQHSVSVSHVGPDFLVAYADEAPPAVAAMVKVRALADGDGSLQETFALTPAAEDHWWPVTCDDGEDHAFVGWGDDTTFDGAVFSYTNGALGHTAAQTYLPSADIYHYHVVWLDRLSRFLAIARAGAGGMACLVDAGGVRTNLATLGPPVTRETRPAAVWDPYSLAYKVVYPTGQRDLAVLKVTADAIALDEVVSGSGHPLLGGITWPSTGIWAGFVKDRQGHDTWNGSNTVLIAMNDDLSNNLVLLPIALKRGFRNNDQDADGLPDTWETHYFGSLTNADPWSDADADGLRDAEEVVTGTDPNNAASRFAIAASRLLADGRHVLQWSGAEGRHYAVRTATSAYFTAGSWTSVLNDLDATPPMNSATLTPAQAAATIYQLRVQ